MTFSVGNGNGIGSMVGSGGSTQSTSFHNAQGMTINGNNNHTTATAAASSSSSSTSTLNPKSNSNSTLPSTSSSQPRPPQDQHSQPNHNNNNNNNPHSQRDWAVLEVLSAARISKQQEWVKLMHLSRLASQHHLSPYSVMKYGELGSPYAYIPLTLQQPDLVESTMAKQRLNEQSASKWMLNKREAMQRAAASSSSSSGLHAATLEDQDVGMKTEQEIEEEIEVEMKSLSPIKSTTNLRSDSRNQSPTDPLNLGGLGHGSPRAIKRPASTAPANLEDSRATSVQKLEDGKDFNSNSNSNSNALGLKSMGNNSNGNESVEKDLAEAMSEETYRKENPNSMDWSATNSPQASKTSSPSTKTSTLPTPNSNSNPNPNGNAFTTTIPSPNSVSTLSTGSGTIDSSLSSSVHFLSVLQAKARLQYSRELQEKEEMAVKEDIARKEREKELERLRGIEREKEREEKERKERENAANGNQGTEIRLVNGQLPNDVILQEEMEVPNGQDSKTSSNQQSSNVDPNGQNAIKTSGTHPINISTIVPTELIPLISERIYNPESGVLPPKVLEGLQKAEKEAQLERERKGLSQNPNINSSKHGSHPQENGNGNGNGEDLTNAGVQPPIPVPSFDSSNTPSQRQLSGERLIRVGPTIDLAHYSATNTLSPWDSKWVKEDQATSAAANPNSSSSSSNNNNNNSNSNSFCSIQKVGNLFLSSCPGKKVRLTGPVRGRGAICRDLGIDLSRIGQLGVGAIVCCLDDEELALLGAPWSEYEKEADSLGIHVVRLPMAEGYAPSDVKTIDAMVTAVASDYSLRGRNVLIHCRGGVGRAGLVACAWLMKMGLVRQLDPPTTTTTTTDNGNGDAEEVGMGKGKDDSSLQHEAPASIEVIQTVESLIETIRRRRSPKAIETAEQVKFVVDYVSYLQAQEKLYRANLQNQQK